MGNIRSLVVAGLVVVALGGGCSCNGSLSTGNSEMGSGGDLFGADLFGADLTGFGGNNDLSVGVACGGTHCKPGDVCEVGVCHASCGANTRCGDVGAEICCG